MAAALSSSENLRNVVVFGAVGGVCGIQLVFCFVNLVQIERGLRDLTCDLSPPSAMQCGVCRCGGVGHRPTLGGMTTNNGLEMLLFVCGAVGGGGILWSGSRGRLHYTVDPQLYRDGNVCSPASSVMSTHLAIFGNTTTRSEKPDSRSDTASF